MTPPADQRRHRCEARYLLAMRHVSRHAALDHLARVEKHRGIAARQQLEADVVQQWQLGNRGNYGDWRDTDGTQ